MIPLVLREKPDKDQSVNQYLGDEINNMEIFKAQTSETIIVYGQPMAA